MRYFIVFYTGNGYSENSTIDGWITLIRDKYPNNTYCKGLINKTSPNPVITNILELTETDFNDFIK